MSQKNRFNSKPSKGGSRSRNNRPKRDTKFDGKFPKSREKEGTFNALKDGTFDSARNDWRWYATNPQLVKDSASYAYGYPLGTKLNLGQYGSLANQSALAGVAALHFVPTFGYSDNSNSPINVAMRHIYSEMRKANAGFANYDPPDMMIYITAMDSCYMILEFMKRVYGVARLVSPVNRYFPQALITAMGVDYSSIEANLDDFRAAINTYAQKLKALVIPAGMSYMAKHQWMVSGIYQDHPTDKSQMYLFVPEAFMKFTFDPDSAGMLESKAWFEASLKTYQDCVDFMNELLNPLLANQDFATMSGDLLKWCGAGGVVAPTGITETYQVFPSYDDSVLDQIQNATLLGFPGISNLGGIYVPPSGITQQLNLRQSANKDYLVSTPWFRSPNKWDDDPNPGRNAYLVKRFVNFMHEGVTPEETMEATRMTNIASEFVTHSSNYYDWFKITTLGSEALVRMNIYNYGYTGSDWVLQRTEVPSVSVVEMFQVAHTGMTQTEFKGIGNRARRLLRTVQLISTFDRHPMVALTAATLDLATSPYDPDFEPFAGYTNDINYYTIIDTQDLEQMAEVALLSEFNVRTQGT